MTRLTSSLFIIIPCRGRKHAWDKRGFGSATLNRLPPPQAITWSSGRHCMICNADNHLASKWRCILVSSVFSITHPQKQSFPHESCSTNLIHQKRVSQFFLIQQVLEKTNRYAAMSPSSFRTCSNSKVHNLTSETAMYQLPLLNCSRLCNTLNKVIQPLS